MLFQACSSLSSRAKVSPACLDGKPSSGPGLHPQPATPARGRTAISAASRLHQEHQDSSKNDRRKRVGAKRDCEVSKLPGELDSRGDSLALRAATLVKKRSPQADWSVTTRKLDAFVKLPPRVSSIFFLTSIFNHSIQSSIAVYSCRDIHEQWKGRIETWQLRKRVVKRRAARKSNSSSSTQDRGRTSVPLVFVAALRTAGQFRLIGSWLLLCS